MQHTYACKEVCITGAFAYHKRNSGSPQEVLGYEENKPLPGNNLGTVCIKSNSPLILILSPDSLPPRTSSPFTKTTKFKVKTNQLSHSTCLFGLCGQCAKGSAMEFTCVFGIRSASPGACLSPIPASLDRPKNGTIRGTYIPTLISPHT